jgi:hypothetical protein
MLLSLFFEIEDEEKEKKKRRRRRVTRDEKCNM